MATDFKRAKAIPALPEFIPAEVRINSHLCPYCCPQHNDEVGHLSDVAVYIRDNNEATILSNFIMSAKDSDDIKLLMKTDDTIKLDFNYIFECNCYFCHNWFYGIEGLSMKYKWRPFIGMKKSPMKFIQLQP